MKRLLFLVPCFILVSILSAQECNYFDPVHGVYAELDVFFGTDTLYNGAIDSLFLDIYKPVGDDNDSRPVIMWYYGGGFSGGTRQDMAGVCQVYAARGFVAVAADYRLGFETPLLLDYPYTYDANELKRANYRAMQDAKGAIRFMKIRAAQDSSDVDNFFAGGFSAGGFTALSAAFWDLPSEKPVACGAIAAANNSIPPSPRPDLGPVEGKLYVGEADATLKGIINVFGGLIDTNFIHDDSGPAVYLYHQTYDPIVPCGHNQPYWNIPLGVSGGYPWVHGSCNLENRLLSLGYDADHLEFYEHPGNEHAIHDAALIDSLSTRFIEELICNTTTSVSSLESSETALRIYPIPFSENFWLSPENLPKGETQIQLIDSTGKVIFERVIGTKDASGAIEIKVSSNLQPGIYFIRVMVQSETFFGKVLKL